MVYGVFLSALQSFTHTYQPIMCWCAVKKLLNHSGPTLTVSSCSCGVWPWLGPPLAVLWYVLYFRFCGWRL